MQAQSIGSQYINLRVGFFMFHFKSVYQGVEQIFFQPSFP